MTIPGAETFLPTLLRIGLAEDWEARLESDLYSWLRQADGTRLIAMTLGYRPVPGLELSVDVAAQSPEAYAGRSAVLSSAGLAYMLKRDLQVDLTLGGRSAGSTPPHRFIAAGFSLRF